MAAGWLSLKHRPIDGGSYLARVSLYLSLIGAIGMSNVAAGDMVAVGLFVSMCVCVCDVGIEFVRNSFV